MAAGGHFGCPKITFLFWPFQIDTELFVVEIFGQNGRRRPFWMGRQCQLSNYRDIWMSNASVKFEERSLNP